MTQYAHVVGGTVRGPLFTPPDDHALVDCFTADVAKQYAEVPSGLAVAEGWVYDGKTFSGPPADLTAAELAAFKGDLCRAVDTQAENLRATVTTPGTGQSMEYQVAQAEATAALAELAAGQSPAPIDYPMLAASIGIDIDPTTGKPTVDVAGEARAVDATRKAWLAAAAAIRDVRLNAKKAIRAATSSDAARAAYSALVWPTLG